MFKGLTTQSEMAKDENLSLSSIRKYAMRPDFPPVEKKFGVINLYHRDAVKEFFRDLKRRRKA